MPQKKIALINDITGFGRCSIAVMAPVVSAMKIQAVAVPTAILSTHTQFPEYYFDDYTPRMRDYIDTYKKLDMSFDAIATGFLGSEEQVDIVVDFIKTFKKEGVFTLVDPVMGDYGRLYKTYTPALCNKMKDLIRHATQAHCGYGNPPRQTNHELCFQPWRNAQDHHGGPHRRRPERNRRCD